MEEGRLEELRKGGWGEADGNEIQGLPKQRMLEGR
jgi:hypothetical protein